MENGQYHTITSCRGTKKILAPSAKGIPTKAGKLYRPAMQASTWNLTEKSYSLAVYKPDTNTCTVKG